MWVSECLPMVFGKTGDLRVPKAQAHGGSLSRNAVPRGTRGTRSIGQY